MALSTYTVKANTDGNELEVLRDMALRQACSHKIDTSSLRMSPLWTVRIYTWRPSMFIRLAELPFPVSSPVSNKDERL